MHEKAKDLEYPKLSGKGRIKLEDLSYLNSQLTVKQHSQAHSTGLRTAQEAHSHKEQRTQK